MVGVMNYWLVKSEPSSWSWDQQVAKGAKGEAWTGVRNFTARQNLVKMKKGDRAFYYHSNEGKDIVGIAEVIREAYPDPTDRDINAVMSGNLCRCMAYIRIRNAIKLAATRMHSGSSHE